MLQFDRVKLLSVAFSYLGFLEFRSCDYPKQSGKSRTQKSHSSGKLAYYKTMSGFIHFWKNPEDVSQNFTILHFSDATETGYFGYSRLISE